MHREGHWLGVQRLTCYSPWESQFPSLGLSVLDVQWNHGRALLCAVSGLGRVFHSPGTDSAGRQGPGGLRESREGNPQATALIPLL